MSLLFRTGLPGTIPTGLNSAEHELQEMLERSDLKVLRWQIVPYFFVESDGYVSGVELFVEYEKIIK